MVGMSKIFFHGKALPQESERYKGYQVRAAALMRPTLTTNQRDLGPLSPFSYDLYIFLYR